MDDLDIDQLKLKIENARLKLALIESQMMNAQLQHPLIKKELEKLEDDLKVLSTGEKQSIANRMMS